MLIIIIIEMIMTIECDDFNRQSAGDDPNSRQKCGNRLRKGIFQQINVSSINNNSYINNNFYEIFHRYRSRILIGIFYTRMKENRIGNERMGKANQINTKARD